MAWRLIYSDNGNYASQAAFEAAHPPTWLGEGESTSVILVDAGPTYGPGGGPGFRNRPGTGTSTPYFDVGLYKKAIVPSGRRFKIRGTYDNSDNTDLVGTNSRAVEMALHYTSPEPDPIPYFIFHIREGSFQSPGQVNRGKLQISRRPPTGSAVTSLTSSVVFPANETHVLEVEGKVASVTDGDGYLRVRVDDVEVYSFDGALGEEEIYTEFEALGGYWQDIEIHPGGNFTNLEVYDWPETPDVPSDGSLIDESEPCCTAGSGDSATSPTAGAAPDNYPQSWTPTCSGEGEVPVAAIHTPTESWN